MRNYQLLWSINERLAGNPGLDLPEDAPDIIAPLIDLADMMETQ